jgi:hypothetical protein
MPNDCYNYLEAPEGDVSLIVDYISTEKRDWSPLPDTFLDFEKIAPTPEDVGDDWYGWRSENWGARSNSYEGQVTEDGISFNTAWSPPIPVIAALAKQVGKPLRLIYDEAGMDFCGEVLANPDGTYVDNCYSPRSDAPAQLKDDLMIDEEEDLDNN